jgi:hypothetical protein
VRTLGEIQHPACKISLFAWNNKFLVKFEQGLVEQTLKFESLELDGEADLRRRLNDEFISSVVESFKGLQALREKLLQ